MIEISQRDIEWFLRDPVLAARCIHGARLDTFQAGRLKYYWFVPNAYDSSGWSSGKTVVEFLFADLRCMLIPDQRGGVYYPVFQTGKDEFWSKFKDFKTDIAEAQYLEGKNEWHDAGCYRKEYKNGSILYLPAPGFQNDANNQVSRRFNFLIVGEYTHAVAKGDGVKELVGRVSRKSFNQHHPVWGNHILLSAHAEPRSHPSYVYIKAAKDAIAGKYSAAAAQRNAIISFCYLDYSDNKVNPADPNSKTFRETYRDEANIDYSRRTLSLDEIRRKLLGLDTPDGQGWYNDETMKRRLRVELQIETERATAPVGTDVLYTLGVDIAPGRTGTADECAFTVEKTIEYRDGALTGALPSPTYEEGGRRFFIHPVFGHTFRDVDAGQISGFIHWLDLCFGLSCIVMDPGGGGLWVSPELAKPEQLIQNAMKRVTPICAIDDPNPLDKRPILTWFKRGSELDTIWPERRYLADDAGIIEAAHRIYRGDWENGGHLWPELWENRSRLERHAMSPLHRAGLLALTKVYKQLQTIRVKAKAGPDGQLAPVRTSKGFFSFEAQGTLKKDAAYSGLYARVATRFVLRTAAVNGGWEDDVV